MASANDRGRSYLGGEALTFEQADQLWRELLHDNEIALARLILEKLRDGSGLLDRATASRQVRANLCRQEAMLTSKDSELSAGTRHDRAIEVLAEEFDLDDPSLDGDQETLGIAGGIYRRKWDDLGQIKDLMRAAELYQRGAKGAFGDDAYPHINAAFLEDLLAQAGDDPRARRERARELRQRIVADLPVTQSWWNAATRAEALLGLGRYAEAMDVVKNAKDKPAPWQLQTTARQLAQLAHMREERPLSVPEIRAFFEALLPAAGDAVCSVIVGKVGLALSGGGFRASFYHLGVLARLAELNVLRHVEVLSCVSGGSIVGACYWLALRSRLMDSQPLEHGDYIEIVRAVIEHFRTAVATNLRGQAQPSKAAALWRLLRGEKGVMDPERVAPELERRFYRPLVPGNGPLYMHQLPFDPADHNPTLTGSKAFHPGKHNWLRTHKVPALVLNATTVNTGHAWQFTPTWMGESPWSIHAAADSIPRLEWAWYDTAADWQIEMGRAVAASACVPGVFAPLRIADAYEGLKVQLVDGGVHDNQGTVSLLALDCNVVLVSDACGQLLLERETRDDLRGLASYVSRSMDTLMERIRLANFADLSARKRSGLLRGLMFVHMKEGLDADTIRLRFSQEAYQVKRSPLSPSGVRKDFQQALAELRTDLDDFTTEESLGLMACGYQMASKAFQRDLAHMRELSDEPMEGNWSFMELLAEITSIAGATASRDKLLATLREGSKVVI